MIELGLAANAAACHVTRPRGAPTEPVVALIAVDVTCRLQDGLPHSADDLQAKDSGQRSLASIGN